MKLKTCWVTSACMKFLAAIVFLTLFLCSAVMGQEKKDLPARAISVFPEYTGIVIPQGEAVDIDLIVANGGRTGEDINVSLLLVPSGWKAWIKTYKYGVTGIHVRSDDSKSLLVRRQPEKRSQKRCYGRTDVFAQNQCGRGHVIDCPGQCQCHRNTQRRRRRLYNRR